MLLTCFFLQYFPELIRNGYFHTLQTTLSKVRNKKETRYSYSEKKERTIKTLEPNPKITRFF